MGKYALVLVSTLIVFTMSFTYSMLSVYQHSESRIAESYGYDQAHMLAQSAMMASIRDIGMRSSSGTLTIPDEGQTIDFGYMEWPGLDGQIRVILTNVEGDPNGSKPVKLDIQTTGLFDGLEYSSFANGFYHPTDESTFKWNTDHGVFSDGSIRFRSGAVEGSVATNSTEVNAVDLNWGGSRIDGTLQVGPGVDPNDVVLIPSWAQESQFVTGGLGNLMQKITHEMPPFPEYPQTVGSSEPVDLKGGSYQSIHMSDYDDYYIPEINIDGGSRLQIVVDHDAVHRIHIGKLILGQGFIDIHQTGSGDDPGRLEFFVEDQFTIGGSSEINHNGDTNDFIMYYGADAPLKLAGNTRYNGSIIAKTADLTLAGSNAIRGNIITGGNVRLLGGISATSRMIYAPQGEVYMDGSALVRGSVVSSTFDIGGGARVIQENIEIDLPDIPVSDDGNEKYLAFEVLQWR